MATLHENRRPLVIFLPGALMTEEQFSPQLEAFSEHFDVQVFDYAAALHPDATPFSIEAAAAKLCVFLKILPRRDIYLCGHSLGGMIAQSVALREPEIITKLVLAETNYGIEASLHDYFSAKIANLFFRFAPWKWVREAAIKSYGAHNSATHAFLAKSLPLPPAKPLDYQDILNSALVWNGKHNLPSLEMPTLILVGSKNTQTHNQAITMSHMIPDAVVMNIPDAGHMINLDNPKAFNQRVIAFLRN